MQILRADDIRMISFLELLVNDNYIHEPDEEIVVCIVEVGNSISGVFIQP